MENNINKSKFAVYHAINPTFGFSKTQPKFPEDFKKVAIVECYNMEDVFRVTNHIDESWTKNPEVLEVIGVGNRSTSVGDIVIDSDNRKFYCEITGWQEIK